MLARAVLAAALAGTSVSACGADPGQPEGSSTSATATSGIPSSSSGKPPTRSAEPTPAVPEVLAFEAPLLAGGTLRGETLAGQDVAFWFWAPW